MKFNLAGESMKAAFGVFASVIAVMAPAFGLGMFMGDQRVAGLEEQIDGTKERARDLLAENSALRQENGVLYDQLKDRWYVVVQLGDATASMIECNTDVSSGKGIDFLCRQKKCTGEVSLRVDREQIHKGQNGLLVNLRGIASMTKGAEILVSLQTGGDIRDQVVAEIDPSNSAEVRLQFPKIHKE